MQSSEEQKQRGRMGRRRTLISMLAAIGSVGIWAVIMEAKWKHCWVYCWGAGRCTFFGVLLGLWVFAFLLLHLRGRIALAVCTAFVYLSLPHADVSPTAVRQASMVGTFRELPILLDAYRKNHPAQGYPPTLPSVSLNTGANRFYEVVYTPVWSKAGGPADDFLITATPSRWCCGFTLSLAMRSDGLIHFNYEARPSTLKDATMPHP